MAYEALDNLQQLLDQILERRDDLITHSLKQQIISIRDHSIVLQLNLKHYPNKQRIRESASSTHEVIEYLFSEENVSYGGSMMSTVRLARLREFAASLKSIVGDMVDCINGKRHKGSISSIIDSADVSSSAIRSSKDDDVVGFEEDLKMIKNRLLWGPSTLQVLAVVGRGGIGKTTLAKTVYEDASVMKYFNLCSWITISQDHSVERIVLNLLASMKGISAVRDAESDIPMESLIHKHLERSRYLIVMDDMWSKKAWDDVKMLFPDTRNGSRIIVTTRMQDVVDYVSSSSSIHPMRLLDAHHSWNLLKQKVFANKDFPVELEDIGKKIVQNCGGLDPPFNRGGGRTSI